MDEPIKEVQVAFTRRIPQVEHTCPVCGNAFHGAKLAVYCSQKCSKKAAWARNGAKYDAQRGKGKKGQTDG